MKKTIKLFGGLLGVFLLLVVVLFNPSIAKEKKHKTLSENKVLETKEDFSKGSFKNIKIKEEKGKASLSLDQVEDGEYITPLIEASFKATHLGFSLKKEGNKEDFFEIQIRSGENPDDLSEWRKIEFMDEGRDGIDNEEDFGYLQSVWGDKFAQAKIIFKNDKKQKLNKFTFTFIDSFNEEGSTKKLTFTPNALAQSVINYFTKNSPHNQEIKVVSREEWEADETLRESADGGEDWPRSYHGTRKIVLHHTADSGSNGVTDIEDNMATLRAIYHYHAHIDHNYWGDIGYNAVIDAAGNIYEGRYGTPGEDFTRENVTAEDVMVLDVEAAHARSYNSGSFGISAMGDFTSFDLPEAQRESIKKAIAFVADSRGIDIQGKSDFLRYDGAWHENLNNVFTHRDVDATACPGDLFYAEVTNIKTETDNFPGIPSNLDGFSALMNGTEIEGREIGTGIIDVDWSDFIGANGYNYAVEKVFGSLYDPQPYETAWMNPSNTQYSASSQISIDTSLLDPYSQYILYVVAVDSNGEAVSNVEHLNFKTNDLPVSTDIISITITANDTISYGTVATSSDTTVNGINKTIQVQNNGTVATDFDIKGQNSADWNLSSSAGNATYKHEWCTQRCDSKPVWNPLTTTYDDDYLASNVSVDESVGFDLKVTVPTSNPGSNQQNVDVFIQATQH